jgi:hypothetical protein
MTQLSTEVMTEQMANSLVDALGGPLAEGEASFTPSAMTARVTGSILAAVAKFLAENSDFLPPKEAVLRAVNSAVDMALARLGRPWLTALISVPIKNMIEKAVDSMYDAILNPQTQV